MGEFIGHYKLEGSLTNSNAGNCRWGFGERGGKEYFIKEFLFPVYPSDDVDMGEATIKRRRTACDKFVNERTLVFRWINTCSDGNLARIEEFFRYGSKFYISMEKIEGTNEEALLEACEDEKLLVCRVLAHSLACMHEAGLVHGDIKMSNIIPYMSKIGSLSAKIIDVDGCYLKSMPPKSPDDVMTDQVYMAPEVFKFIRDETGRITEKADVFSMGLCLHYILTGGLPRFNNNYRYAYQSLLNGCLLELNSDLSPELQKVIGAMLVLEPESRPSMCQVFDGLWGKETFNIGSFAAHDVLQTDESVFSNGATSSVSATVSDEASTMTTSSAKAFLGVMDPPSHATSISKLKNTPALKTSSKPSSSIAGFNYSASDKEDYKEWFSKAGDL